MAAVLACPAVVTHDKYIAVRDSGIAGDILKHEIFCQGSGNACLAANDIFKYMYSDMPEELVRQKAEYEQFLNWKESRK